MEYTNLILQMNLLKLQIGQCIKTTLIYKTTARLTEIEADDFINKKLYLKIIPELELLFSREKSK